MSINPAGPISVDELKAIAELPYGQAAEALRKHDPFWGRAEGDKIKWTVEFSQRTTLRGYATVEASSQEEADALAEKVPESQISWDYDSSGNAEVEEVYPS